MCARGTLPSKSPLNPSHCFLSIKAAARDYFNADGNWLSLTRRRIKISWCRNLYHCVAEAQIYESGAAPRHCVRQINLLSLPSACLRTKLNSPKPEQLPASPSLFLPPVFVRLVLLASVGVSRGLLRESGGSDSMCGCWLWWWGFEKIPFCCTAPPAIIFELAVGCLGCVCV